MMNINEKDAFYIYKTTEKRTKSIRITMNVHMKTFTVICSVIMRQYYLKTMTGLKWRDYVPTTMRFYREISPKGSPKGATIKINSHTQGYSYYSNHCQSMEHLLSKQKRQRLSQHHITHNPLHSFVIVAKQFKHENITYLVGFSLNPLVPTVHICVH